MSSYNTLKIGGRCYGIRFTEMNEEERKSNPAGRLAFEFEELDDRGVSKYNHRRVTNIHAEATEHEMELAKDVILYTLATVMEERSEEFVFVSHFFSGLSEHNVADIHRSLYLSGAEYICYYTGRFASFLPAPATRDASEPSAVSKYAYEKYKLHWMLVQDFSLSDLIDCVQIMINENMPFDGEPTKLTELFADWEYGVGFGSGSIWPCFEEFLGTEYLNQKLMLSLLPDSMADAYRKDISQYASDDEAPDEEVRNSTARASGTAKQLVMTCPCCGGREWHRVEGTEFDFICSECDQVSEPEQMEWEEHSAGILVSTKKIQVSAPAGTLAAEQSGDEEHPGIAIDFFPKDSNVPSVVVEYTDHYRTFRKPGEQPKSTVQVRFHRDSNEEPYALVELMGV